MFYPAGARRRPPGEVRPVRRSACSACGADVIWAVFPDRVVRPIESCPDGDGTIALQSGLPGLGPPRRIEARIVSGVRTSYRSHLETCPRAYLSRNRLSDELACCACGVEMAGPENGRSVCVECQARQRAALHELAGHMVEELGQAGAAHLVAHLSANAAARISRGKR